MKQTTISNLADQLAEALGMAPRALAYIVDDLSSAGMIGQQHESATVPGNIGLSGSPGRTCASLRRDRAEGIIMLRFDMPDFLGGVAPFGLPPASPLRTVEIPSAIFQVLRDALENSPHSWANAAEGRVDVYSRRSLEGD